MPRSVRRWITASGLVGRAAAGAAASDMAKASGLGLWRGSFGAPVLGGAGTLGNPDGRQNGRSPAVRRRKMADSCGFGTSGRILSRWQPQACNADSGRYYLAPLTGAVFTTRPAPSSTQTDAGVAQG